MLEFYAAFRPAAAALGIAEIAQSAFLERAQKTLWAFGQAGRLEPAGWGLTLDQAEALQRFKFPRPEETFSLVTSLGLPVIYQSGQDWSSGGKLKTSRAIRLEFQMTSALQALSVQVSQSSSKPKVASERFLRVNPQSVVAGDKPPLDLPPDAPAILANLPAAAGEAWRELVGCLAGFSGYSPTVEFRSIHHGMWVANDEAKRAAGTCAA